MFNMQGRLSLVLMQAEKVIIFTKYPFVFSFSFLCKSGASVINQFGIRDKIFVSCPLVLQPHSYTKISTKPFAAVQMSVVFLG